MNKEFTDFLLACLNDYILETDSEIRYILSEDNKDPETIFFMFSIGGDFRESSVSYSLKYQRFVGSGSKLDALYEERLRNEKLKLLK